MEQLALPMVRNTKRQRILELFSSNVGREFSSFRMHEIFGTAFRSRVSEINRDDKCPIVIKNRVVSTDEAEHSTYWSEIKRSLINGVSKEIQAEAS